jgi:TolA-binding protein
VLSNGDVRGVALVAMLATIGCAPTNNAVELDRAREALAAKNYAIAESAATSYLGRQPTGPRAAEAYYLRGRALEDKVAANDPEARTNLQQARTAYIQALKVGTKDKALEGLIRAALADVAYWQVDYVTTAEQGLAAYPLLTDANTKSWTLYRAGVAQKRLGKFAEADKTLGTVIQQFPGTDPARHAQERVGMKEFLVQTVTLTQANMVDRAVADLQKQGFLVRKKADAGKTQLFVGPYPTFQQAMTARNKVSVMYKDARVWP